MQVSNRVAMEELMSCILWVWLCMQDLGQELEKRNITKEAEATKIVDAGLEQMPGVSSSTTSFPTAELTPREVGTILALCNFER